MAEENPALKKEIGDDVKLVSTTVKFISTTVKFIITTVLLFVRSNELSTDNCTVLHLTDYTYVI